MAVAGIDPSTLHSRLAAGEDLLLLDVREPWECGIAALEGSSNVPMGQIPALLGNWPYGDTGREIVVICHHGIRSLQVARFLEAAGFTNLLNLEGGIHAWSEQVDPELATY